jgi:hypothetical protein
MAAGRGWVQVGIIADRRGVTMKVLISERGVRPDDWLNGFSEPAALGTGDVLPGADLVAPLSPRAWETLRPRLGRLAMIRIRLRDFGDCDALDLARDLRAAGYAGRLRAQGAVLARDWPMARRSGFSEVALTLDQAHRQPPEHWSFPPEPAASGVPFAAHPA